MIDNMSVTVEKCMDTIRRNLGTVELETFIYYVRSQNFDYTKWQREHYDSMTEDEIYDDLKKYSAANKFEGKKATVI